MYAGFDSLLEPKPAWRIGEFPLSRGGTVQLREPDAVSIVQNGGLRTGVSRFTRRHDKVQILDNAKHVVFSTETFDVPDSGITFTIEMSAEGRGCLPGDIYDGFASFLCLDFSTGTAIDLFCRDDLCAAVFARLPFPGLSLPDLQPLKYWALFSEERLASAGAHTYEIAIRPRESRITWSVDGALLRAQALPDYRLGPLMLGLGLMTEKDIGSDGSVSCHGQGVRAEWSPIHITT
ncbi:MAG: DUF6081 family protein [Actinomycetota bacterium]|nr:DUF6081 family protein [Actinomycetota bacterium]